MNSIILAGGFGTRYEKGKNTCKALLPFGGQPLLNWLVNEAITAPQIKSIHILHNALWASRFRSWKKHLINTDSLSFPYIRLHNSCIKSPKEARGALGDLLFVLMRLGGNEDFVLQPADTPHVYTLSEFLSGVTQNVTTVAVRETYPIEDTSQFGAVTIEDGRIIALNEKGDPRAKYVWAGPTYFARSTKRLLAEYLRETASDNLGTFIGWLCERTEVRAQIFGADSAIDIGAIEALKRASLLVEKNRNEAETAAS